MNEQTEHDTFSRRPRVFAHLLFLIPAISVAVIVWNLSISKWLFAGCLIPIICLLSHAIYCLGTRITFSSTGISISRFGNQTMLSIAEIETVTSEMTLTQAAVTGMEMNVDKSHAITVYDRRQGKAFHGIFSVSDWDVQLLKWLLDVQLRKAGELARKFLANDKVPLPWIGNLSISGEGIHHRSGRLLYTWDELKGTDCHHGKGLIYANRQGMPVIYLKASQPRFREGMLLAKAMIADGQEGVQRLASGHAERYLR